jgi:hypothetical protein
MTDIRPTSVAAVSCQALSPAFSQLGYGKYIQSPSLKLSCDSKPTEIRINNAHFHLIANKITLHYRFVNAILTGTRVKLDNIFGLNRVVKPSRPAF